jgi:hypothetical protein
MTEDYPYYYAWKNNPKRLSLCKRPCRILSIGSLNSIMIQFEDGQTEIVSRNAIRRLPKPASNDPPGNSQPSPPSPRRKAKE